MATTVHHRRGDPDIVDGYRCAGATSLSEDPAVVASYGVGHRQYGNKGLLEELSENYPVLLFSSSKLEAGFKFPQDDGRKQDHSCTGQDI